MEKIIKQELITNASNITNKNDLFKLIAKMVFDNQLTNDQELLFKDLQAREKIGSTAFENGLMIPHAQSEAIKKTTIVIVDFDPIDFQAIDEQKTNFALAILVPKSTQEKHLEVLSKISSLLSTKEKLDSFKKLSKTEKVKVINSLTVASEKKDNRQDGKTKTYDFVAITSCAAGIAHTYMARDALVEGAKKLNLTAKVETRGARTENKLTSAEIDHAKFVIIASDVLISKKIFLGKKIIEVSTKQAIKDAVKIINQAKETKVTYGKGEKLGKLKMGSSKNPQSNKILGKAIMAALSYMIPITIAGGLLMAIPNALAAGGNAEGGTWAFPNSFSEALWNFGKVALTLMVPILAMFLAFKIGGKPAMPAALIGGYFINDGSLMYKYSLIDLPENLAGNASAGFLGGLVVGIMVGYLVKYMQWVKWPKYVKPISNLLVVPLLSSFLTFLIILYVIGSPMTYLMSLLYKGLSEIESAGVWANMGVGMLFAGLMAIDLGGPINKTSYTVSSMIFFDTLASGDVNLVPQTASQAAISVPPIGMWMATVIFRKKFSVTEMSAGAAALPMGLVGITEGALPFAFKNPAKAIFANVSGALVAGALVSLFGISFYGGLGSPLGGYIGYAENSFYGLAWVFSTLMGALVTALIFGLLRKRVPSYEAHHAKIKANKKAQHQAVGLNSRWEVFCYHLKKQIKKAPRKFKKNINPKNWIEKPSDWDSNQENDL